MRRRRRRGPRLCVLCVYFSYAAARRPIAFGLVKCNGQCAEREQVDSFTRGCLIEFANGTVKLMVHRPSQTKRKGAKLLQCR